MAFYKTLLIIAFITCFGLTLNAQVNPQWVSYYNSPSNNSDIPVAMTVDNSGNIYVTGVSPMTSQNDDYLTVKYNSAGVEQWTARYHTPGSNDDLVRAIAVDNSGNVYVSGSVSYGGSNGVQITVKYNSAGVEQWVRQLGEPVASPAAPGGFKSSMGIDASGNIYIGGIRKFGGGDNGGMLLIKYTPDGDSLWTRRYKGTQFLQGLGSAIGCLKVQGNYIYVTGKSFDMNPNRTLATTIKYDLSGDLQWIKHDSLAFGSDDVIAIDTDASDNVIIACNFAYDILTIKYDAAGNKLWRKTYNGIGGTRYDLVTGMETDQQGNIYLTGTSYREVSEEDFLTLKYDAAGDMQWERFYNGNRNVGDYSKGIALDALGNVYVTGLTYEIPFNDNFMTIKYNSDGAEQWRINYDGGINNRHDEAVDIATDPDGDIIVTGFANRSNQDDYATIKYSESVGITQTSSDIPEKYTLSQNYPNPFNPATKINYKLQIANYVLLKVYDVRGIEVAELVNEKQKAGSYTVDFDGSNLPSGIYFYKIYAGEFSDVKRMNLVK